jgi:hypothetical protein
MRKRGADGDREYAAAPIARMRLKAVADPDKSDPIGGAVILQFVRGDFTPD